MAIFGSKCDGLPGDSSVVVVGASVAGVHVAERLRDHGFAGSITLVGAEPHLPYDRPPLSKQILYGGLDPEAATIRSKDELHALDINLRLGLKATGWDGSSLALSDGSTLKGDRLVIATGVRPRRLPRQPEHPGIGNLRTLDDAKWLAGRLARGGKVVIVGGGFIGAEVASAARRVGCLVTVLEAERLPLQRVLGAEAAGLLADVLAESGVAFHGEVSVSGLGSDGDRVRIDIAHADPIFADTVVVGIGGIAESSWLGLGTDQPVQCDASGRAILVDNAYAVGDVAAWLDPTGHDHVRFEHWSSARHQADVVAADIAGAEPVPADLQYVWSDQFDLMIQLLGRPELADRTVLLRPPDGEVKKSVALYFGADRLVGCCLFSSPRLLPKLTILLRAGADEAAVRAVLDA